MAFWQDKLKIFKIALILSLIGGFIFVYYIYNPSTTLFIPCPFYYVSGFYCPGCGSQRAIHLLLHGNIIGAFRFNPLMVITIPIMVYGLGVTIVNWIFGTKHRFRLFYSKLFIFSFFGMALLYWVLRNIPYYPFKLLAPMA
ncbi:DUF2752 domain-containing protein [Aequorivita xiaoshiensis]|uniref:DUF2752 domain-containing protein n=1 Tax=Aequorivita xiaoshiensis TaxID=2874476 RepID=A0A9X1U4T8_9FLAO|nr:DUF2752 domain-containing protein [Aequorivita xiaoshiensis]